MPAQITPGDRFARWTVTSEPFRNERLKCRTWCVCAVCDCGGEGEPSVYNLTHGFTKGCSACGSYLPRVPVGPVQIGERFGEWTVVELQKGDIRALCECSCGARHRIAKKNLRKGQSTRCVACATAHGTHRTHGATGTSEYGSYSAMVQRCTNPKTRAWSRYGGRGITVAPEWMGSGGFERFIAHIGPKPSAAHSIDRIDNDGNYAPGNVRWATSSQQMRNTCRSRLLPLGGALVTLEEAGSRLGISRQAIHHRLDSGWTPQEAATTPKGQRPERLRKLREQRKTQPLRQDPVATVPADVLDRSVTDLGPLSTRARGVLRRLGAKTIRDLAVYTPAALIRFPNCGRLTVRELCNALADVGVTMGSVRSAEAA